MKFASTVAVLLISTGFAAQAATLDQISGEVFDRGGSGGFRRVFGPTEVKTGDAVMASAKGSAQIVLDDGCVIRVEPGQTVVVPAQGCVAGSDIYGYAVAGSAAAAVATGIYFALQNDKHQTSPLSP